MMIGFEILGVYYRGKKGQAVWNNFCIWCSCIAGDIPAATAEDVNVAVEAARKAFFRNGGKDWPSATGAHRAKYLRAIAAKVLCL